MIAVMRAVAGLVLALLPLPRPLPCVLSLLRLGKLQQRKQGYRAGIVATATTHPAITAEKSE